MNQADAHFAGLLVCPVCRKETRHYTKDTHDSPVSKIRRIWCDTKSCTDKLNYGLPFELVRAWGRAASNLGKFVKIALFNKDELGTHTVYRLCEKPSFYA